MALMTPRERVLSAANRSCPDRVPLDLGSHPNGSMHVEAYERLKQLLGVQAETRLMHRWMQVAVIDEEVLTALDIDTRCVPLGRRDVALEHDIDCRTYVDQWGVVRHKPEGASYYELQRSPLAGEITTSDIIHHPWPDPHDPGITRGLRERAMRMRQSTRFALILTLPSPFVHGTQFIRGFQDWYIDCVRAPLLAATLFDAVLEINLALTKDILREVGDLIDVVVVADDLGAQDRLIVSPSTYRKLIKPRQARYLREIHWLTSAKVLYHSCGSVFDILNDLAEIGVDILHPIQMSAAKMEADVLKTCVGDRIAFWGGIDSQHVLPFGSVSDVEREVKCRIQDLGAGGGYVLSPTHNIQTEVPPENVCALYRAAKEYGGYKPESLGAPA